MSQRNLYARFAAHWDDAAIFLSTPTGEQYTYGDVDRLSGQVAGYLTELGVVAGDRVSVQADKSVDYLWLYLACLRSGAIFHPLNTAYTAAELKYFFNDAEPKLVIYDPANPADARAVAAVCGAANCASMATDGQGTFRDGYMQAPTRSTIIPSKPDDPAVLLYSSGTTGQPKGIPLSHENVGVNAFTLRDAWGFTRDDVLLHALPMFHAHGLFISLSCSLASGSEMRYLTKFAVDDVIDALPRATVMMGVPTYYTRLLGAPRFNGACCKTIRLFTSGSAPLRVDTFEAFEQRTGQRIVERYGMSETVVISTNPLEGARKPGTVGLPLAGVDLRIANAAGDSLAIGQVGRIQVRGANVFNAYWRRPDKTAEDFTADGFFDTGDQGFLDDDGYVTIVGRMKDLIISGGLNVYPIEVEQVINEIEGVAESAVIGVPHPDFGEAVVAVVTINGDEQPPEAHIRDQAATSLANFKVPKRVICVDELPRNAMGKVQKNLLRERYCTLFN